MRWALLITIYLMLIFLSLLWGVSGFGFEKDIMLLLRLPRILIVLSVGGGLAVSGVLVQAIFSNPIADPFITGIASAAALGATLGVILNQIFNQAFPLSTYMCSVVFSLGFILVLFFSLRNQFGSQIDVILWGVVFSLFMNAASTFLRAIYFPNHWSSELGWLLGSIRIVSVGTATTVLCVIFALCLFSYIFWRGLDAIAVHEQSAISLGMNIGKFRGMVFLLVALITSICVLFGGIIGFVGLIVPHLARALGYQSHRFLIGVSFIMGGTVLMGSDLMARFILQPSELPVGIVTSLLGAPFFIILLKRGKYTH